MTLLKNIKAFSLMEVTVAAGLLAIVLGGSIGTFQTMTKANNAMEAQTHIGSLVTETNAILGSTNACTAALAGTNSVDNAAIALTPVIQANGRFSKYLTLNTVTIENVSVVQGITRRADVTLQIDRNQRISMGDASLTRTLPLFYTVDANNQIAECIGPNMDLLSSCEQLGGVFDNNTLDCDFCQALGGVSANGICNIPVDPQAECIATGGTWNQNGNPQCDYCALLGGQRDQQNVCVMPFDPAAACVNLGGVWDANANPPSCSLGDLASACASFGGVWDANAGACDIPPNLQVICENDFGGNWDATVNPPVCDTGGGGNNNNGCVRVNEIGRRSGIINMATSMTLIGDGAIGRLQRNFPNNTATAQDIADAKAAFRDFFNVAQQSGTGNWPAQESNTIWRSAGAAGGVSWSMNASRSSLFRGDCGGDPNGPPWCERYTVNVSVTMCALP